MGAGLEDVLAVKALQHQKIPPIPNLKEPDPSLGDLLLSKGGPFTGQYAIRLAAGFGSQLALLMWKKVALDPKLKEQLSEKRAQWLSSINKDLAQSFQLGSEPWMIFEHQRKLCWGPPPKTTSSSNAATPKHTRSSESTPNITELSKTQSSAPEQSTIALT